MLEKLGSGDDYLEVAIIQARESQNKNAISTGIGNRKIEFLDSIRDNRDIYMQFIKAEYYECRSIGDVFFVVFGANSTNVMDDIINKYVNG